MLELKNTIKTRETSQNKLEIPKGKLWNYQLGETLLLFWHGEKSQASEGELTKKISRGKRCKTSASKTGKIANFKRETWKQNRKLQEGNLKTKSETSRGKLRKIHSKFQEGNVFKTYIITDGSWHRQTGNINVFKPDSLRSQIFIRGTWESVHSPSHSQNSRVFSYDKKLVFPLENWKRFSKKTQTLRPSFKSTVFENRFSRPKVFVYCNFQSKNNWTNGRNFPREFAYRELLDKW